MGKIFEVKLNETIKINESTKSRTESEHLISSNKEKCRQLLNKTSLGEGDIIDVLIALHIILEVGLNTLFRHLSLMGIKKDIDEFEIIKNIDAINFIDKTVMFIYNSKFDFSSRPTEASDHHRIIGTLKNFAGLRNQLLHGHSISSIFTEGEFRQSPLKRSISPESLSSQIEKFKIILGGMRFYIDCLDSSLNPKGKEGLKKAYLNDDFLPKLQLKGPSPKL